MTSKYFNYWSGWMTKLDNCATESQIKRIVVDGESPENVLGFWSPWFNLIKTSNKCENRKFYKFSGNGYNGY